MARPNLGVGCHPSLGKNFLLEKKSEEISFTTEFIFASMTASQFPQRIPPSAMACYSGPVRMAGGGSAGGGGGEGPETEAAENRRKKAREAAKNFFSGSQGGVSFKDEVSLI